MRAVEVMSASRIICLLGRELALGRACYIITFVLYLETGCSIGRWKVGGAGGREYGEEEGWWEMFIPATVENAA
jgi:hypothetical protein